MAKTKAKGNDLFISRSEIMEITGVGKSKAGQIIKEIKERLKKENGIIPLEGKLPRKKFFELMGIEDPN